jgi:ribosome-associated protein
MEFSLKGQEYIELNALLKTLGLVETGGHAKIVIDNREVKVNGAIETRKRNKLRVGDIVLFQGKTVKVVF